MESRANNNETTPLFLGEHVFHLRAMGGLSVRTKSAKKSLMNQKIKYYPAFDYLRIFLAIVVASAHGHAGLIDWENSGNYPVQVFFALSGWLIGGILLRSKPSDLPRFYFNRAARIWIPYFVAIALLFAACLLKDRHIENWFELFFYDMTFVYNFWGPERLAILYNVMPLKGTGGHFWSICAEEQFYLFAPFLITLIPAKLARTIWFWTFISALALASHYWFNFGAISLGVLASVVNARFGDWHSIPLARLALIISAVLGFAAIYLDLIAYRVGAPLSALAIVLSLARYGANSRVASFVGGVSYPLYLNHWIGIFMANAAFGEIGLRDTWICQISGVLLSIAVASVLYVCIDRNVRNNRERYFTVSRGKAVAGIGFALLTIGTIGGLLISQYAPQGTVSSVWGR
jgi:peptidoglycan/LPS O-acetylase OafA/YrhL